MPRLGCAVGGPFRTGRWGAVVRRDKPSHGAWQACWVMRPSIFYFFFFFFFCAVGLVFCQALGPRKGMGSQHGLGSLICCFFFKKKIGPYGPLVPRWENA